MGLNVAGGHAPGVEGNDLVIETGEAALTFGEDDRFEGGVPVAGNGHIKVAELALDALFVAAVAGIGGLLLGGRVFLVAEMIGHLGLHRPFKKLFGELLEQPVLPDEVFRILVILHQGVEQVFRDGHQSFLQWLRVVTD